MTTLFFWGEDAAPEKMSVVLALNEESSTDGVHLIEEGMREHVEGAGNSNEIYYYGFRSFDFERKIVADLQDARADATSQKGRSQVDLFDAAFSEIIFKIRVAVSTLKVVDGAGLNGRIRRIRVMSKVRDSAMATAVAALASHLKVPVSLHELGDRFDGIRKFALPIGLDLIQATFSLTPALREAHGIITPSHEDFDSTLFFEESISGARSTYPILKEMMSIGNRVRVLTTKRGVRDWFQARGVHANGVDGICLSSLARSLFGRRREMLAIARRLSTVGNGQQNIAIQLAVMASLQCVAAWSSIWTASLRKSMPRSVVLGTSAAIPSRVLEQVVGAQSPVFCVQHGLLYDTPYLSTHRGGTTLTWGVGYSELLKRWRPSVKCVEIGYSITDDGAITRKVAPRSKMRDENGGNPKLRVLVALSRIGGAISSYSNTINILEIVKSAASHFRELEFIIRLHPGDSVREELMRRRFAGENIRFDRNNETQDAIRSARIVIVTTSTVGPEAVLLEKDVIAINIPQMVSTLSIAAESAAVLVNSTDELVNALSRLLNNEESLIGQLRSHRAAFQKRWQFRPDSGQSPEKRAAFLIAELVVPSIDTFTQKHQPNHQ